MMQRATLDRFVSEIDHAMVAVTARAGSEVDACLVGFHTQCSIEPFRYAVFLSIANHTYRLARQTDVLAVHRLTADLHALADRVGGTTLDEDPRKMDRIAWRTHPSGAVILDGVASWLVGRVVAVNDTGDHHCFVLEPIDACEAPQAPPLRLGEVGDIDAGH